MPFGLISGIAGNQLANNGDNIVNMLRRMRLNIGWRDPQRGHIFMIFCAISVGNNLDIDALFCCCRVYLVVNIGNIAGIADSWIKLAQKPHQNIKHYGGACIADMRGAINRWTTYINCDEISICRLKLTFLAGKIIMQKEPAHEGSQ